MVLHCHQCCHYSSNCVEMAARQRMGKLLPRLVVLIRGGCGPAGPSHYHIWSGSNVSDRFKCGLPYASPKDRLSTGCLQGCLRLLAIIQHDVDLRVSDPGLLTWMKCQISCSSFGSPLVGEGALMRQGAELPLWWASFHWNLVSALTDSGGMKGIRKALEVYLIRLLNIFLPKYCIFTKWSCRTTASLWPQVYKPNSWLWKTQHSGE